MRGDSGRRFNPVTGQQRFRKASGPRITKPSPGDQFRLDQLQRDACPSVREQIFRLQALVEGSACPSLSLSELSELLNLERTYCSKIFRQITGELFSRWLRRTRIRMACRLLSDTMLSVTLVSQAVGYADITTFERNFRKELGISPRAFRKSLGIP